MTEPGATSNNNLTDEAENSESNKFEYETQLFGFTPITLLNGMYNAVCDLYREALKTFCSECKDRCPDICSEKLRQSRHLLSECIDKDISKVFDTLEFYLLNQVFSIPENAVLPEDKCQLTFRDKNFDLEELEIKKSEAKKKIIALKYANAELSQHLSNAEALQKRIDNEMKKLATEGNISQATAKGLKDWLSYNTGLLLKE